MVVPYWCVRAQPLDMKVHGGVDLPGQEPDPRRGHVNSRWGSRNEVWVSPWMCEACAWDTASFHSRRGSPEALKAGEKVFLPLLLQINAVLFKLHQYLVCNKASQYVGILFRATAAFSEAISQ